MLDSLTQHPKKLPNQMTQPDEKNINNKSINDKSKMNVYHCNLP